MKNPFLIGERVYLRPLERSDALQMQGWINDPEVRRTLQPRGPINLQGEEEFIDRVTRGSPEVTLGIAIRESDLLIGALGTLATDVQSRHAGIGLMIGEKREWGKGYGTEALRLLVQYAFETLNLNRVWLHVYGFNKAALRVYEKLGFQQEGVLRQHHFGEGRYHDTITMAILKHEWH